MQVQLAGNTKAEVKQNSGGKLRVSPLTKLTQNWKKMRRNLIENLELISTDNSPAVLLFPSGALYTTTPHYRPTPKLLFIFTQSDTTKSQQPPMPFRKCTQTNKETNATTQCNNFHTGRGGKGQCPKIKFWLYNVSLSLVIHVINVDVLSFEEKICLVWPM